MEIDQVAVVARNRCCGFGQVLPETWWPGDSGEWEQSPIFYAVRSSDDTLYAVCPAIFVM